MKRILAVAALCLSLCLVFSTAVFAADISKVSTDLPNITVDINGVTQIDPSKVNATLDGRPLKVGEVKTGQNSVEWIVMLDTSRSVREAYFTATKKALKSLYNSMGENETMQLYYFDSKIVPVLNGTESKEEAAKKIDAIAYVGQETVFYDTLGKLSALSSESKADTVIPVIFTDGVDTKSAATKADGQKALAAMPDTFRAFYPDNLSAKDKSNFTELMKNAKGKTVAYGTGDVEKKFSDIKSQTADSATLTLTAEDPVAANENAALRIDLGDGKPLTAAAAVEAWEPATEPTTAKPTAEPTTEPVTGDGQEEGSSPILFVVIAVVVLILAAIIFFAVKKNKSSEEEERERKKEEKEKRKEEKEKKNKEKEKAAKQEAARLRKIKKEKAAEKAAKEREKLAKDRLKEEKRAAEKAEADAKAAQNAEESTKNKADKSKKKDAAFTVAASKNKDSAKAAAKAAKEREKLAKERRKEESKSKQEQEKADSKAAKEAEAQQKRDNKRINKEKDKNAFVLAVPNNKNDSKAAAKAAKERQKAAEKLAAAKKAADDKTAKPDSSAKKAAPSKREQKAKRREEQGFMFYFQDSDDTTKNP